jgi:hypothetical protein
MIEKDWSSGPNESKVHLEMNLPRSTPLPGERGEGRSEAIRIF